MRLPAYLAAWIQRQRWYANRAGAPVLALLGTLDLDAAEAGARIRIHLVRDTSGPDPVLYQVPVTERADPLPGGEQALIAGPDADDGRYHYDGPHDPAFARELLRLILHGDESRNDAVIVRGVAFPAGTAEAAFQVSSSRVLRGEQSNTSIVFELTDADGGPGRPIICKLFRMLHAGENPDVAVQNALAATGCAFVPEPLGYLRGAWPGGASGQTVAHLAFAQEFLPDAPDAWQVAQRAAAAHADFGERARALGEATAAVHADLAAALPTEVADEHSIAAIVDDMRARQRTAQREVPALAEFAAEIEAIFATAQAASWPRLQRIHGDYHLGQVLEVPGRGWMLIDFEGEPLRPMNERGLPDVALRDVAGMLRSLSYVAGTLATTPSAAADALAWADAARASFLAGYFARSGQDSTSLQALLDAFELDKAIYESLYEVRHRPDWLPIPLAGVRRLVERATPR